MNGEVQKSHAKMSELHAELGADMFESWRAEHAKEALTKEQSRAVEKAHQSVPR